MSGLLFHSEDVQKGIESRERHLLIENITWDQSSGSDANLLKKKFQWYLKKGSETTISHYTTPFITFIRGTTAFSR